MPTILCIDDQPISLELEKALLESKGYKVFTALDGISGIAITRTESIDAVVLDFNMPGLDGNQVAKVLRDERPSLPVVIWSGSSDDTPASLKWFADVSIHKGDGPLTLLLAIEQILKRPVIRRKPAGKAAVSAIENFGAA